MKMWPTENFLIAQMIQIVFLMDHGVEEARRGRRLEKWEEGTDLGNFKGWAGSKDLPTNAPL